jgi:hypothetical protein
MKRSSVSKRKKYFNCGTSLDLSLYIRREQIPALKRLITYLEDRIHSNNLLCAAYISDIEKAKQHLLMLESMQSVLVA